MNIIKRSGAIEKLTKKKIFDSITKANGCVGDNCRLTIRQIQRITDSVVTACEEFEEPIPIDKIEDMIEKKLMESSGYEVAKAYITYRYEKEKARNQKTLADKLFAKDVVNQNANIDEHSFTGRIGEAASAITKQFAMDNLISEKAKQNHNNNEIYIHDLDHYAIGDHNCAERNMWVKIKVNGEPRTVRIGDFADGLGMEYGQLCDLSKASYSILSRDGWTKLRNITKRKLRDGEKLYEFHTRSGLPLKVTENHRLPIIRGGKEILVEAKEIVCGDSLLDIENVKLSSNDIREGFLDLCALNDSDVDIRIENVKALAHYVGYKYGVDWVEYCKKNNFHDHRSRKTLTLDEFNRVCSEYELSFDVLSQLTITSNGSKHSYPLHIPYSEELAKLYAYIYADGGVYLRKDNGTYQLTFTNTNETIVDDFVDCYESVFGYRLKKSYPQEWHTSSCIRVVDGGKIPCKIFKDFAGARKFGSADISMPDFVLNGSDNIKYAFLSAMIDTDGSLGNSGMTYTTCGDLYSDQLVFMLQSLGYHPHKTKAFSAGTKYRFGVKSGIRNFDIYNVKVNRSDEMFSIQEHTNTVKYNDSYVYRGIRHKFVENKITKIVELDGDYDVFDVETASHWFIINNYVSHNCLSIPFDHLLKNGFNTRQVDIRPAQSVNTAFQLVAVIFQLQSLQQFGGVSATHLDWTMVPYVRKSFAKHFLDGCQFIASEPEGKVDERRAYLKEHELSVEDPYYTGTPHVYDYAVQKTLEELNQAVEGMYHNLNSLQSRSGGQVPFTSINYGACTLPEGQWVIEALLNGSIKGLGKFHRTSIFPCGIFQLAKGINRKEGDPNYYLFKLALQSTAKRLYPNYANVDWTGNAGYDKNDPKTYFSTMGCHEKNTLIWMADGSKKKVQDIAVGDLVMGPDKTPRTVNKLIHGRDELVKVKYVGGDSYVVNWGHVLALKCNKSVVFSQLKFDKGTVYFVRVFEFIQEYSKFKEFLKGYDINGNLFDIEIEQIGDGEFFGFDIDKDRLYVIDNGIVTHNCRTANGADINADEGVNPQTKDGRGNICPVTIIMPTLAMEAKEKVYPSPIKEKDYDPAKVVPEFMKLLDKKIHEAKDMLLERFDWICSQPADSAKFMYENGVMLGYKPEEGIRSALKHGTLVIGQLGLAETLQLLIGKDQTDGGVLDNEEVIKNMIKKMEEDENRKLTEDEVAEVRTFVEQSKNRV